MKVPFAHTLGYSLKLRSRAREQGVMYQYAEMSHPLWDGIFEVSSELYSLVSLNGLSADNVVGRPSMDNDFRSKLVKNTLFGTVKQRGHLPVLRCHRTIILIALLAAIMMFSISQLYSTDPLLAHSLSSITSTQSAYHIGESTPNEQIGSAFQSPENGTHLPTQGVDHTAAIASPDVAVGFKRSQLIGGTTNRPTTLQFGPDGRLYVAQQDGLIYAYTIARAVVDETTVTYTATATETITLIQSIPNHHDDGSAATWVNTRQVTGILTDGTGQNPILYVSSSDPRIAVDDQNPPSSSVDTNSGIVSRLTWNGTDWEKVDLVRGLPRSKENHSVNGMALDEGTNTLFLMVGGATNMGAPSTSFSRLPEYALSAALLSIDLNAIGNNTYDLPTLDDEDRAGVNDANDPFGGNLGKNQAIIDPTGPIQIYSPGWRNAYDVVLHSSGKLYTVDNGSNADWGNAPTDCTNLLQDGGITEVDVLQYISGPGYYGGHPNPTRANQANTFNATNPQSPVPTANPVECDYLLSGDEGGAITTFAASTNGLIEYRASNFNGALQGQLLTASYTGKSGDCR